MASSLRDIRRFRTAIRVLEREIARDLKSQTSCCQVTAAQCHLLMELDGHQPHTVNGLAAALGLDKSTLSRTLDGMAAAELVERAEDPRDRRALRVTLTEKGQRTVRSINDLCDDRYRELLEQIPGRKRREVLQAVEMLGGAMKSSRDRRGAVPGGSARRGQPDHA
jgi:DNA-binding MarR family transcriptional regulator